MGLYVNYPHICFEAWPGTSNADAKYSYLFSSSLVACMFGDFRRVLYALYNREVGSSQAVCGHDGHRKLCSTQSSQKLRKHPGIQRNQPFLDRMPPTNVTACKGGYAADGSDFITSVGRYCLLVYGNMFIHISHGTITKHGRQWLCICVFFFTLTAFPITVLRKYSLASAAHGSSSTPRRGFPTRGARMEDSAIRRSCPTGPPGTVTLI